MQRDAESSRYRLGHDTLGPIFAAFARLLITEATAADIRRLAFVARDGEFLLEVTRRLIFASSAESGLELSYLYLSRISTALPSRIVVDRTLLEDVSFIRAGTLDIESFLAYFGISRATVSADLDRIGLSPATPIVGNAVLDSLFGDAGFVAKVAAERARQRSLLLSYLHQEHVLGSQSCALVDIGWRATIPAGLIALMADEKGHPPPHAYQLGYWHELGCHPLPEHAVLGLLADIRRSRGIVEGSAYYVAQLLEAICRASHGTVTGYRRNEEGQVEPVLTAAAKREAELHNESWREPIRHGILDFIDNHAAEYIQTAASTKELRRRAQRSLLRLAFFPSRYEIAATEGLRHTEGHAENWSRPLIDAIRPSPLRHPRGWLAGLASPWRAGYVAATGGNLFAFAYFLAESALCLAPMKYRRAVRKAALGAAQRR